MREVVSIRGGDQDVLQEALWGELKGELAAGVYDLLFISPPCHTHSRARSSGGGRPGPRPVRSANYPWGFPWLEGKALRSCELANKLVLRTFEAIEIAFNAGACHILEHPEDLGATPSGEVPAAIWQHSELRDIPLWTGAVTWAMFQCMHGATSSKPSRWMSDLATAAHEPFQGWLCIGAGSCYLGPLPRSCPHGGHALKLIG
jgi:hypothetical protein